METLTNQQFMYRETPASENGTGTITSIKGNTIVWNQQNNNINGNDTYKGITYTKNSNGSWTITGTSTESNSFSNISYNPTNPPVKIINGHKYLITGGSANVPIRLYGDNTYLGNFTEDVIYTAVSSPSISWTRWQVVSAGTRVNYTSFHMVIDLTMMFGAGNEPTLEEFKSMFPLSWYQYDAGSLLSFNGTGLKSTGKNLLPLTLSQAVTSLGVTYTPNSDGTITVNGTSTGDSYAIIWEKSNDKLLKAGTYRLSGCPSGGSTSSYKIVTNGFGGWTDTGNGITTTLTDSVNQTNIVISISSGTVCNNLVFKPMITDADVSDQTFEPYMSSTASLPVSTYFTNGMKRAGRAYDELTETKAIQRIKMVNLGSISKSYFSKYSELPDVGVFRLSNNVLVDRAIGTNSTGIKGICSNYEWDSNRTTGSFANIPNMSFAFQSTVAGVAFRNDAYDNVNDFWASLDGVYLAYELEEPIENDVSVNMTFNVDVGGTEEVIPNNTTSADTTEIICDIDYRGMIPVQAISDPLEAGNIEGTGDYRYMSEATLIATPTDEIYRFLRWEDENGTILSLNSEYTFTVGE